MDDPEAKPRIPGIPDEQGDHKVIDHNRTKVCNAYVVLVLKSITNLDLARGTFDANYTFVCRVDTSRLALAERAAVRNRLSFRIDDQAPESFGEAIVGESTTIAGVPMPKFVVSRTSTVAIPFFEQLRAARDFPFDEFEIQLRFEIVSVWVPQTRRRIRFKLHHPKDKRLGFHGRRDVDKLPDFAIKFAKRDCWGMLPDLHGAQPVIVYGLDVARIPNFIVWATFFPMLALQALLVMLHTMETIDIGDMATIMLALFAFLIAARNKSQAFPRASMLDKTVFVFVLQLILVCLDLLYERFYPDLGPDARPVFLIVSTVIFGLQLLTVSYWWFCSVVLLLTETETNMEAGELAQVYVVALHRNGPPPRTFLHRWFPLCFRR